MTLINGMTKNEYQRAWRISHPGSNYASAKRYSEAHPGRNAEQCSNWRKNNADKSKVHSKMRQLKKLSDLKTSDFECAICGAQPIDLHHENYDEPYVVIPLCKLHHRRTHSKYLKVVNT